MFLQHTDPGTGSGSSCTYILHVVLWGRFCGEKVILACNQEWLFLGATMDTNIHALKCAGMVKFRDCPLLLMADKLSKEPLFRLTPLVCPWALDRTCTS